MLEYTGKSYIENPATILNFDKNRKVYTPRKVVKSKLPTKKLSSTQLEIISYLKLEDGWDGVGSIKPKKAAIIECNNFLELIYQQYKSLPVKCMLSGDGEVSLYLTTNNNHLEVGFEGDSTYTYFIKNNENFSGEEGVLISDRLPDALIEAIKRTSVADYSNIPFFINAKSNT